MNVTIPEAPPIGTDRDVDLDMPQPPLVSPETDPALRLLTAQQAAAADAIARTVDTHLLEAIGSDDLPAERQIDSETAVLQAESTVHRQVKQVIGEALVINAEASESIAIDARQAASEALARAEARRDLEQSFLRGETLDPDGACWYDVIPFRRPPFWKRALNVVFASTIIGLEGLMSFASWQYAAASGTEWWQLLTDLGPVALSTLALSALPLVFVPGFARARRGGVNDAWHALIAVVPLAALGLAALRTHYVATAWQGEPPLGIFGMGALWFLMFIAAPLFVFIGGVVTHNPHRSAYLEAVDDVTASMRVGAESERAVHDATARVRRARAGRDAVPAMYDAVREDALPASGEHAKAIYRTELSRSIQDPAFTGGLVARD